MSSKKSISAKARKRRSGTMMARINSTDSLNLESQLSGPINVSEKRKLTIQTDLFDGVDVFDSISSESNLIVDSDKSKKSESLQDDDLRQFQKFIFIRRVSATPQSSVKNDLTQKKQTPVSNPNSKEAKVTFSEQVQPSSTFTSKKELKQKQINISDREKTELRLVPASEAQTHLDHYIKQSNSNFLSYTDQFTSSIETLRNLSNRLKSIHDRNITFAREFMKYEIALDLITKEFYEGEIDRIRSNIDNSAKFLLFITQQNQSRTFVDLYGFNKQFIKSQGKQKDFIWKTTSLKSKIRSLPQIHLPNDPNDIISHYMDPSSETGRIMQRFKVKVAELRYPDVEIIADAISEKEKTPVSGVINVLFDCAWYFRSYPVCDSFKCSRIPRTDMIIPKVFDPPFLEDEWIYMTFDELSSSDWPLKPAVDELFDLMIITNPFEIAKKFYSIINNIGKCVQRIFIRQNKESKYIDIDFDQLFVLMLLCVFTSGLSEIVAPMIYSYSFREFIMEDYQIQYAMSHMEGLCQHIKNIDWNETRRKSFELQEKHASTLPEPLSKK